MNLPLEKIYWKDICGLTSAKNGWMTKTELIVEAESCFNGEYVSIGYVVHETEDYLAIAATHDCDETDSERRYHDASMIMKSVIIRRELLGPAVSDTGPENPDETQPDTIHIGNVAAVFEKANKRNRKPDGSSRREEIVARLKAGKKPAEIAVEFGVSRALIYNYKSQLKRFEHIPDKEPEPTEEVEESFDDISPEEQDLIWEIRSKFVVQLMTPPSVCAALGIDMARFIEICKKHGIHR